MSKGNISFGKSACERHDKLTLQQCFTVNYYWSVCYFDRWCWEAQDVRLWTWLEYQRIKYFDMWRTVVYLLCGEYNGRWIPGLWILTCLFASKYGRCLCGYQKSSVLVQRDSGTSASVFSNGEGRAFGLEQKYRIEDSASCVGRCSFTDGCEFGALLFHIQDVRAWSFGSNTWRWDVIILNLLAPEFYI
jgi:hypothetical protein